MCSSPLAVQSSTRSEPHPAGDRPRRRWLKRVFWSCAGFTALVVLILLDSIGWGAALGGSPTGARLERMRASPYFRDGQFHNVGAGLVPAVGNQADTMRAYFRGDPSRRPAHPLPVVPREAIMATLGRPPVSGLRITWLGHSTLLVEIDGHRLLTDPVFSLRASPSSLIGTKRFQAAALAEGDLPPLDGVILSHDHYDHLDFRSVQALNRRRVQFYVPLGVGAHLERWGVPAERIHESGWWEKAQLGDLELVAVPAHHFSGRRGVDYNRTLWTSWVLRGPAHRVFFSGDSGLASVQQEIGERFGPFDLALLDIGAWNETWADIHFGPRGAAEAFGLLRARRLMPVHWATFELAVHAWDEPIETLSREAAERHIELVTPMLGEPLEPTTSRGTANWWRGR